MQKNIIMENHLKKKKVTEQIGRDSIVLDANGSFPKKLIFIGHGKKFEYRLIKTRLNKFILNK